ncbi:MAG: DUF2264 domain-containing protein [Lachnospiraceae bacterium]|nr:DUF2264 domain-containing protein [Lachnospiraceae bacterium]
MVFQPKMTDFEKSPYTGLTRESFIEAGEYLLQGIFTNIKSFDDPVIVDRSETKITYPHGDAPAEIYEKERRAEIFEGLTRSFFIAAPLIHNVEELTVCGYNMRDYYKNQILRVCTKGDACYVGNYGDLQELSGYKDAFQCFQQTVETCALVIGLWMCKGEIWDTYTKAEKDIVAEFLSGFAHGNTVPQNWRLFNMLDLAFLHMEGYPIDKEIMLEHAQEILHYYAGDGWYRDGHSFDYYSCWAFNVYAPLWNLWYGYENEPYLAARFEEHSNKLMETYGDFFDSDGFTNMWGRSNIYRNASTAAFAANMLLKNSKGNPGLARRIVAGSLMQFLSRGDFLIKGVPGLGFYGQFSPLVQGYSCAESPFWLGKAFLCLCLPETHPFWTAQENNGSWEKLVAGQVKETVLNGPALCFTNHKANGETILRTGKVVKNKGDIHGMWNYSKLCFNTKYPWEATPAPNIESQQYILRDMRYEDGMRANVTFWHGEKKGILYRRQFFDYELATESHWFQAINLADFPIAHGIVRADKIRLWGRPVELTLGAYGFPDNGTEIIRRQKGNAKALILKGKDFTGKDKQLAMTVYDGWSDIQYVNSTGTNPDSEKSIVVYAVTKREKQYGGYEPHLLISQVITKESLEDFTDGELFAVKSVTYADEAGAGNFGTTVLTMWDGSKKEINFEEMEAHLAL